MLCPDKIPMRYSQLFTKSSKTTVQDQESANARLLGQAGFVDQLMAGVYSYLPLGLRVLQNIQRVIREELDMIGAQEILMPALHPAEPWKTTGRWTDPGPGVMFQFTGSGDRDLGLGWTHEEIVTPLLKKFVHSYKDLPVAVYQIQDKFRDEPRAKSGLLRGREFNMKDLYSFHRTEEDAEQYYETVKEAYKRIFFRLGIQAIVTEASGGAFSKYSHEFQMPSEAGEDHIFANQDESYAWNKEIVGAMKDADPAPDKSGPVHEIKAIEVGNIFQLKTRFTEPFGFTYADEDGTLRPVYMGCYGIGPSRCLGAIVESSHDDRGMIWPKSVAPFLVHLVGLGAKDAETRDHIRETVSDIYEQLQEAHIPVLWDDREDASTGEKLADADLIGLPLRILVSEKTLKEQSAEWKERKQMEASLVKLADLIEDTTEFANTP